VAEDAPAFFSYCREDSDFALQLAEDVKAAGASVWLDQLDIVPGQRWDRAVEEALASCPRMLVILSPASANSTNVMDEVSFALEEKKTVIPVIHKDCPIPFRLRRVQYIDFRHDYARGLKELLKTLSPEHRETTSAPAPSDVPSQRRADVTAPSERDRGARLADERNRARSQPQLDQERREAAQQEPLAGAAKSEQLAAPETKGDPESAALALERAAMGPREVDAAETQRSAEAPPVQREARPRQSGEAEHRALEESKPRISEAWAGQEKAELDKWRRRAIVVLVVAAVVLAVVGTLYGFLTALSILAAPLLCILAVSFVVTQRRKPGLVLIAIIPLALTSVSIQLGVASITVVDGFRDMGGMAAVASIFASVASPLLWRFVEAGLCVAVAMAIAPWVESRWREKEARESPPGLAAMIVWPASALVAVAALVWFYHDIVDWLMVIVDPCRTDEALSEFGSSLGLGRMAAMLSRRLVLLQWSAPIITLCLLGIGFYCLRAERRTRRGFAASMIVAGLALVWCSVSAFAEWSALSYLQGPVLTASAAHPIYHKFSRSPIDSLLDSQDSDKAVPRAPAVQLAASNNSIRFPDANKEDAVILTVSRDGRSFLGKETPVQEATVVDSVKDLLANRFDKTVYVRADARTSYGAVAQVFSQLRTAGVDDVALLTVEPKTSSCLASGLEVLIPAQPVAAVSVSAPQRQNSQVPPPPPALPSPASVPTGTGPRDPIVIQVFRSSSGGVQWKINRNNVSSLSELTAQLADHFKTLNERVVFLTADETVEFRDFVDGVDAAKGAGMDKVGVVIGKIE
jgi:biopolymer transport protein ExbD